MGISLEVPQKLKIKLSYDPTVPLLCIQLNELRSAYYSDTCIPMFIIAQCTMANMEQEDLKLTIFKEFLVGMCTYKTINKPEYQNNIY